MYCDLFKDTFNISDFVEHNDKMFSEQQSDRDGEGGGLAKFKLQFRICYGRSEEDHEEPQSNIRSPDRYLKHECHLLYSYFLSIIIYMLLIYRRYQYLRRSYRTSSVTRCDELDRMQKYAWWTISWSYYCFARKVESLEGHSVLLQMVSLLGRLGPNSKFVKRNFTKVCGY